MFLEEKKQVIAVGMVGGLFILSAAFALLVALGAQTFLHMVPCQLCLWERAPWRVLLGIGVLTVVISPSYARWIALAGLSCVLISVGLSILHVGVEHGLWPSPAAECHVSLVTGHSFDDWMGHLPARPAKPCDLPDYPFGLPLSMTSLSALYSFSVFVLGSVAVVWLFRFVRNEEQ